MRIVIAVVLLLVTAGCGSDQSATTTAATTPAATPPTGTAAAEAEPFGEYEREVTEDEITTTPGQEPPAAGTWHLSVGPSVIQVVDASGFRFSQELAMEGDTLEIERYLGGDGVFCEEDAPSTYRWELAGEELTLTAESDGCPDREAILAAAWQKVG